MKINRQEPPINHPVNDVSYIAPETFLFDNGLQLFTFHSASQDLLRLEFVFENYVDGNDSTTLNSVLFPMMKEGTNEYLSAEIAEVIDFYGGFFIPEYGMDYSSLTIYIPQKYLGEILPVIYSVLTDSVFPEQELETFIHNGKQRLLVALEKNSTLARKYLFENTFGDNRYGKIIDVEALDDIKQNHLMQLYKDQIVPQNCTLFVAGNITTEVLGSLKSYFGSDWDNSSDSFVYQSKTPSFVKTNGLFYAEERNNAVQSSIRLGVRTIDRSHSDFPAFQFLNTVLGGYFGSRLMRNIREEKGYSYGVQTSLSSLKHSGLFMIATDVGMDFTEDTVRQIDFEIERLRNDVIQREELELVRNYILGSILGSIESIFSHADKFKNVYFSGLGLDYYKYYSDQINSMTPEKLRDLAIKYLHFDQLNKVIVGKKINSY